MKVILFISAIALAVVGIGCSGSAATKTPDRTEYYSDFKKDANTQAAEEEAQRRKSFESELASFNTTAGNTSDRKALEPASKTRGWFAITCDLEWDLTRLTIGTESLTDPMYAKLAAEKGITKAALDEKVKPFVATYVYAVSQVAKQPSGNYARTKAGYGCGEVGSRDTFDMLVTAEAGATKYGVDVESNGFAPGEMRKLIVREIRGRIVRDTMFEDILSGSPDRVALGIERFDELLRDIDDLDLTDDELGITPQIRKVLNDDRNTTSG